MYANINGDETTGTRERFNLPASGAITRHPVEVVSKRCVCMYVKVHVRAPGFLRGSRNNRN